MRSPKIENGDLVIDENGDIIMLEGDEELKQAVEITLQTRNGEFFLESEHGLVFDNLTGKEANKEAAYEDIIEAVSQEERITSVEEVIIEDNRKARTSSISITLQKDSGEVISIEGVEIDA